MSKWKKQSHVIYQCTYHIIWCPKYRYRILKGELAQNVESSLRMLCEWKRVEILELNIQEDHIHMVVSVPPKLSISELMGILKGKTAIKIFKSYPGLKKKPYWGNHFWSRGYCVTTLGMDEEKIRKYVKYQERNEREAEEQASNFGLF
jgi:putative transposase